MSGNGRVTETLWYCENPQTGRVYLADVASTPQPGYNKHSTTSPKQMDRIYARMNTQEREHNEKMLEQMYSRNRHVYEAKREGMKRKLASSSTSVFEKSIIREAMKLMDERDSKMQENHRFGVSALQESPAPLEGPRTKVTVN